METLTLYGETIYHNLGKEFNDNIEGIITSVLMLDCHIVDRLGYGGNERPRCLILSVVRTKDDYFLFNLIFNLSIRNHLINFELVDLIRYIKIKKDVIEYSYKLLTNI